MKPPNRMGLVASVPWPVRLFGDWQDEFGLPAIVMATDLRTAVGATPRDDELCSVEAPWLSTPVTFDPASLSARPGPASSLVRSFQALRDKGVSVTGGFDFKVYTRVPAGERLPDSAAFATAWVVCLLALDGRLRDLSGAEVAEMASAAFQARAASPVAVPEIAASVLGGTLRISPGPPLRTWPIEREAPGIVLAYPRKRPRKSNHIRTTREEARQALRSVQGLMKGFSFAETNLDETVPRLGELPERHAGILYALLSARDLCNEAYTLLEDEHGLDDDKFGEMLDTVHGILGDYFGLRFPGIEKLVAAAKGAGALGCRICSGADSLIAFAPGKQSEVIAAVKKAGGDAHPAAGSDGMYVEGPSW